MAARDKIIYDMYDRELLAIAYAREKWFHVVNLLTFELRA